MNMRQDKKARADSRFRVQLAFISIVAFVFSALSFPLPALAQETCGSTGAHGKHGPYDCTTCHAVGGAVCFDPAGLAFGSGMPDPTFDAAYRTCSNVACHSIPEGTFSYWFQEELKTVTYGGDGASTTPSWFSTVATCSACHGNPPPLYPWHSGNHSNGRIANGNECQLCHPDAYSVGGVGTTITDPTRHGDGIATVEAMFRSACFYCH